MAKLIKKLLETPGVRQFTLGEEISHSITHGFGSALSIAGLVILVYLAARYGDIYQVVSFSIFGISLVVLYLSSTLYHGFQQPRVKQVFKVFDHSAIFLLIAGTYTPFLLVAIRGTTAWILLSIVWMIALAGVLFKIRFIERFQVVFVIIYILMGWLCLFVFNQLIATIPIGGIIWIAVGGLFYMVGVIFYALQKIPYMHVVWHFFVLGGSISHYFAVLFYLAPI